MAKKIKVSTKGSRIENLVMALFMASVFVFFAVGIYTEKSVLYMCTESVTALVIRDTGWPRRVLVVQYEVGGITFTERLRYGMVAVGGERRRPHLYDITGQRIAAGNTILIFYNPDNPTQITGGNDQDIISSALVMIVPIICFPVFLYRALKKKR